jgi:hypothetical protein
MDQDQKLEKEIEQYQAVAKDNKNVDVSLLMMNALQNADKNAGASSGSKKWPYLISLGLPPFGLIYAFKYYFSDEPDGKQTTYMCLSLTALSILLLLVTGKMFFSTTGVTTGQIQQIKINDIRQLNQ